MSPWLTRLGLPDLPAADAGTDASARPARIVLLGFSWTASSLLEEMKRQASHLLDDVSVVDFNPVVIERLRARGVRVIYGDISQRETLLHAGLAKAEIIVCSLPDMLFKGASNRRLLRQLQELNPDAKIIIHSENVAELASLYADGASYISVPRLLEADDLLRAIEAAEKSLLDRKAGPATRPDRRSRRSHSLTRHPAPPLPNRNAPKAPTDGGLALPSWFSSYGTSFEPTVDPSRRRRGRHEEALAPRTDRRTGRRTGRLFDRRSARRVDVRAARARVRRPGRGERARGVGLRQPHRQPRVSNNPTLRSGPMTALCLIVNGVIATLLLVPGMGDANAAGVPRALTLAFACIALAGAIQILFGVLKLGHAIKYVPRPVLSGFRLGLAAIIIVAQIPPDARARPATRRLYAPGPGGRSAAVEPRGGRVHDRGDRRGAARRLPGGRIVRGTDRRHARALRAAGHA